MNDLLYFAFFAIAVLLLFYAIGSFSSSRKIDATHVVVPASIGLLLIILLLDLLSIFSLIVYVVVKFGSLIAGIFIVNAFYIAVIAAPIVLMLAALVWLLKQAGKWRRDQLIDYRLWWRKAVGIPSVVLQASGEAFGRVADEVADRTRAAAGRARVERPLFHASLDSSDEASKVRKDFVRGALAERAQIQLLEIPPNEGFAPERMELKEHEAIAQKVQLLYQLSSAQALLFGRATDAIICIRHKLSKVRGADKIRIELILRRLRASEHLPGDYPWVVVVRTNRPRLLVPLLRELRSWLGIGIHISGAPTVKLQRGCKAASSIGTVAGIIKLASEAKLALTCGHVIPDGCSHALYRRPPGRKGLVAHEPDLALLHEHECWGDDGTKNVQPVYQRHFHWLMRKRGPLMRIGGASRKRTGCVVHELRTSPVDDVMERFPACTVRVRRLIYVGFVPWPLLRRPFSERGDSGSWVLTEPSNARPTSRWLGMVASGDEVDESVVILASPLMMYLRMILRDEDRPIRAMYKSGDQHD